VPDLVTPSRVLSIAAHPDDIDFGTAGGTWPKIARTAR
jgi:LmbE family N-acetylglucosaminyl deacetylase